MVNSPLILVTDDDADDRFLVQAAFAEKKYPERIEFIEDGVELLNYLNDLKEQSLPYPAVILLDLNMPKKDGRESLKEIKENPEFRHIPIFIFTTTNNEQEIYRCTKLGAERYIVKPVTFEGLLKVVDDLHKYCMTAV